MIKHLVMWKLQPGIELDDPRVEEAAAALRALKGVVPGLIDIHFGTDFSRKGFSYDLGLTSTLENREALDGYQVHPAHMAAAGLIVAITAEKALVDFEV